MLELWNEIDVLLMPVLATTAIAAEGAYGKSAPIAIDRPRGSCRGVRCST